MKLKAEKRIGGKKSENNRLRHEENIPAVIYGKGSESVAVSIDAKEFAKCLRMIEKGHLSTTIFELHLGKEKFKAIVKDIHYRKTTYNVAHLDFLKLSEDTKVKVNVPVQCIGEDACVGIKLGGFLRLIKRHIKVSALPKDMPKHFVLDIKGLGIKQTKRVKDIIFPSGVKSLHAENDVVVVIAK